eukprot:g14123.t1
MPLLGIGGSIPVVDMLLRFIENNISPRCSLYSMRAGKVVISACSSFKYSRSSETRSSSFCSLATSAGDAEGGSVIVEGSCRGRGVGLGLQHVLDDEAPAGVALLYGAQGPGGDDVPASDVLLTVLVSTSRSRHNSDEAL